jgi:transposase-like protein
VDEKEIKINGVTIFIWGAVDIDDEKVLAVCVSFGRSGLEAKAFFKKVRDTCKGRLPRIFIGGGSWYHWALRVVCFKRYTVVSLGPRNAIERLFSDIERRIGQFWNGFIGKYSRKSLERWVKAFAGFRNCTKDLKKSLKLKVSVTAYVALPLCRSTFISFTQLTFLWRLKPGLKKFDRSFLKK